MSCRFLRVGQPSGYLHKAAEDLTGVPDAPGNSG